MNYNCPLDGTLLSFSCGGDEENDAYRCSFCGEIYPTLNQKEVEVLKDIETHAISRLKKYKERLEEIKKEEGKITRILDFTKKSGLLSKLNKPNLSEEKVNRPGHPAP